jgi:hypothetical protein
MRVCGDLFDGCGIAFGLRGAGQVETGDLEAVEEETSALGVDFIAGDAAQDFADGALDCGAIFREGDIKLGLTASTPARVLHWTAGGVVVVTKFFLAQARTAAAMSVGEDVAALEAFRLV